MAKRGPEKSEAAVLLAWYDRSARRLPWRVPPGAVADPYRVWLSEIMLQQTTVATVRGYYDRFLARWPSVEALAEAPLDEVLKAWAGLGYYARARNLHACARRVAAELGGRFPATREGLGALPGIGPYTAAAIAAIAFDRPHAAVDGNVERVISRLHAIAEPLPAAKQALAAAAQALVPDRRPGDFAQAMMDLGATVCTPRNPRCGDCPWADRCLARRKGIAETLPRRMARKAVPTRYGAAFWIERADGAVLLRRRPEKGLLGGMMEVPSSPWREKRLARPASAAPLAARWRKLAGTVEHTFSHFRLELTVLKAAAAVEAAPAGGDYRWVAAADLAGEALPTVMRKVVAHARR